MSTARDSADLDKRWIILPTPGQAVGPVGSSEIPSHAVYPVSPAGGEDLQLTLQRATAVAMTALLSGPGAVFPDLEAESASALDRAQQSYFYRLGSNVAARLEQGTTNPHELALLLDEAEQITGLPVPSADIVEGRDLPEGDFRTLRRGIALGRAHAVYHHTLDLGWVDGLPANEIPPAALRMIAAAISTIRSDLHRRLRGDSGDHTAVVAAGVEAVAWLESYIHQGPNDDDYSRRINALLTAGSLLRVQPHRKRIQGAREALDAFDPDLTTAMGSWGVLPRSVRELQSSHLRTGNSLRRSEPGSHEPNPGGPSR